MQIVTKFLQQPFASSLDITIVTFISTVEWETVPTINISVADSSSGLTYTAMIVGKGTVKTETRQ